MKLGFEKLKTKNIIKMPARERKSAFIPDAEMPFEKTAARRIDSITVNTILTIKDLLKDDIQSEEKTIENVFIASSAAKADINRTHIDYDAITSSSFNDPGARVSITDGKKIVELSAHDDYNLGLRFATVSVGEKTDDGKRHLSKMVEFQAGSGYDGHDWSYAAVTEYKYDSNESYNENVGYDMSFDREISAVLSEAMQVISSLPGIEV